MTVHLLKTAVGIADIEHLRRVQQTRRARWDGREIVRGYTRNKPRRETELVDGGSIFWIVKGRIQVRQRVFGLADAVDDEGRVYCEMHLDPDLVETVPVPRRPIQGWRYLAPAEAPGDLDAGHVGQRADDDTLPPHLARELRELGLL
ncbi:MAG: DUF1489 domain-containing protein [Inquilinus sp.]|nr:DUF1489 domain-containing protein [Inquilinus sp.]